MARQGAGLSLTFMRMVQTAAAQGRGMLSAGAPPTEGQSKTSHPDSPAEWSEARRCLSATVNPLQTLTLKETLSYSEPSSCPPPPSHVGSSQVPGPAFLGEGWSCWGTQPIFPLSANPSITQLGGYLL